MNQNFINEFAYTYLTEILTQIKINMDLSDPAHDLLHIERVVTSAIKISKNENAKLEVVLPAAYLHDIVSLPKDNKDRKLASKYSAEKAVNILIKLNYPSEYYNEIYHAILTHSFSANIPCETLEAKIIQDADRLDALGAIGVARCFSTSGKLARPFYSLNDPFGYERTHDDSEFSLDHFYKKLLKLENTFNTNSAKKSAKERTDFLRLYLNQLKNELE